MNSNNDTTIASPASSEPLVVAACVEFEGFEYETSSDDSNVVVRLNTCNSARDKIGDLDCQGADIQELLYGRSGQVAAVVVAAIILLAIVVLVVVCICKRRKS